MINNDIKSEMSSLEETRLEFNPGKSAIKLGIDVHQEFYVVVCQEGGSNPKPAQRFRKEAFLCWAARLKRKTGAEIQKALQAAKIDGWLFYDFRGSDPLALRILKLDEHAVGSRRWFFYVPATGECVKLVHRIEPAKLDALPGKRQEYSSWKEQHALLRAALNAANKKPRIAMQYSPMNDVPLHVEGGRGGRSNWSARSVSTL
jgi:hypothetical protein